MRSIQALLLAALLPAAAAAQDGTELIRRMHERYAGTWYTTLTFVQKTTLVRPDGTRDTATWFESVKGPALLRIDVRSPRLGNGILYTADSSVVMRDGEALRTRPDGNPFMPLIMGVYLQPVETTVAQLTRIGFDLDRTTAGTWDGKPVVIVGTDAASDSSVQQFWIDPERLVLVRMRIAGVPNGPLLDVQVGGYQPIDKAWLATRIGIFAGNALVQDELYTEWRANVPLEDALFDPAQWRSARHWAD